ncbi:MAG TPA: AAA family ATPase [Candidatus Dormibacteraeota bacterium]|nr:AAA family ATPase [Candidatus Dormibacteraeota bacterium]
MSDQPTHNADPPADADAIDEPVAAPPAQDPATRTPAPGSRVLPSHMARAATRTAEPPPADASSAQNRVDEFRAVFASLRGELARVIVGQSEVVEEILIALFAGGHVLIEGVPGTGKTLLVRTLAQALNLSFNRIQFTIDLMPADITGTRMLFEQDGHRELVFARGPIFAHVLLADEINRATPKTQSALLEAMAERQVTVAGTTHQLSAPFFVLATLNPIEMEGTYPLPEAQLDRFLFKVFLPYPSADEMQRILRSTTGSEIPQASAVFPTRRAAARVEELKALVREVLVAPQLEEYAATLVRATIPRTSKFAPGGPTPLPPDEHIARYVSYGSSPRGGQALLLGAKVRALLAGRVNVSYDDIDRVAVPALNHRLVLNFAARADDVDPRALIHRLVDAAKRLHR